MNLKFLAKANNLLPQLRKISPLAHDVCTNIIKTLESFNEDSAAVRNWISRDYLATDFTAATGTWTVAALDIEEINYRFIDDYTLFLNFLLNNATATSAGTAYLKYNLPHATVRRSFWGVCEILVGGAREFGSFQGTTGETFVRIYRQGKVAWPIAADIEIKGQVTIPVYTRNS